MSASTVTNQGLSQIRLDFNAEGFIASATAAIASVAFAVLLFKSHQGMPTIVLSGVSGGCLIVSGIFLKKIKDHYSQRNVTSSQGD